MALTIAAALMKVETSHHIDASEPNADGMYDYRYEYDTYTFSDGTATLIARSYSDEDEEAHFLRIEVNGEPRFITSADLERPLLTNAVTYLHQVGKKELNWLNHHGNGYERLKIKN